MKANLTSSMKKRIALIIFALIMVTGMNIPSYANDSITSSFYSDYTFKIAYDEWAPTEYEYRVAKEVYTQYKNGASTALVYLKGAPPINGYSVGNCLYNMDSLDINDYFVIVEGDIQIFCAQLYKPKDNRDEGANEERKIEAGKSPHSAIADARLAEIAAEANKYSTDLEKLRFINNYAIANFKYQHAYEPSVWKKCTTTGLLENNTAVCSGFADFLYDICTILNIPVAKVRGPVYSHETNIVQLDGKLYLFDLTWDIGYGSERCFLLPLNTPKIYDYLHTSTVELTDSTFLYPELSMYFEFGQSNINFKDLSEYKIDRPKFLDITDLRLQELVRTGKIAKELNMADLHDYDEWLFGATHIDTITELYTAPVEKPVVKLPVIVIKKAVPSAMKFTANSKNVNINAYDVDGKTYIKLRDLAKALSSTKKKFSVSYDSSSKYTSITLGKTYTTIKGDGILIQNKKTVDTSIKNESLGCNRFGFKIDTCVINGSTYYELKELASIADTFIAINTTTKTAALNTSK